MAFFDDPSVEDLATNHVNEVLSLEEDEAKPIIKSYRRVRHELRDRLDSLPTGSFSAQRVRAIMVQVDAALASMTSDLMDGMKSAGQSAAELGIGHIIDEIDKWNKHFEGAVIPINIDAVKVASNTKNLLINQYESSMDAYSSSLRGRIANGLMDATVQNSTMGEVVQTLSKTFLGEEWKLERIVRTELHNIYNRGKLDGMGDIQEEDLPDLQKTLFHPMDSRTGDDSKRLNRHNPIVNIDDPFIEDSTGKTLVYMAPPNRPNDRAILIPYRKAWKSR
jgi:hypothetical protein